MTEKVERDDEVRVRYLTHEFKLFWDLSDPKKRIGYFALKIDAPESEMLIFTTRNQAIALLTTLVTDLYVREESIEGMVKQIFNSDKLFPENLPRCGEGFPQLNNLD